MTDQEQQLSELFQKDAEAWASRAAAMRNGDVGGPAPAEDDYGIASETYFHDAECRACGTHRRYRLTHKCVACTKREEKAKKLKDAGRYMADRPCLKCGTRERYISNKNCCECNINWMQKKRSKSHGKR